MTMTTKDSGALVQGASLSNEASMAAPTFKAKVIAGCGVRGTFYPEGAIVDLTAQELSELMMFYKVVRAKPEEIEAGTAEKSPDKTKGR